jgi:L-fuculose-phosphate aldolase
VVADSVQAAHRRVLNMEEAARLTYAALLLGDTDTACPPAYRDRLRRSGDH